MREKTKIKVSSYNIASIVTTNESEEEKRKKIEKEREKKLCEWVLIDRICLFINW